MEVLDYNPDGVIHADSEWGGDLDGPFLDPDRPRPPVCSDRRDGLPKTRPPRDTNTSEPLGLSGGVLAAGRGIDFCFCGLKVSMACVHFIGEIRGAVIDCALGIAVCVRVII